MLYLLYIVDFFLLGIFELYDGVLGIHYPMIVVVIYIMGYMGLCQPDIFSPHRHPMSDPAEPETAVSDTSSEPA
jgi:hypothetical protein